MFLISWENKRIENRLSCISYWDATANKYLMTELFKETLILTINSYLCIAPIKGPKKQFSQSAWAMEPHMNTLHSANSFVYFKWEISVFAYLSFPFSLIISGRGSVGKTSRHVFLRTNRSSATFESKYDECSLSVKSNQTTQSRVLNGKPFFRNLSFFAY